MAYRIMLASTIGEEGIGLFQKAFPVYSVLVTISAAGLPTAIAKLVSERTARGDEASAQAAFRLSRVLLIVLGLALSALLGVLAGPLARMTGSPETQLLLYIIMPSILIVSVVSAYRGWFQGLQNMTPTAASQIVEQIVKLVVGVYMAKLWASRGPAWGAAGAFVGITVSEACSCAFMLGCYSASRKKSRPAKGGAGQGTPRSAILRQLLAVAVPITLGAAIMPIAGTIDTALVPGRLALIGVTGARATELFGVLNGAVNPLLNMPSVLFGSLAVALLPAVSAAMSRGERKAAASISRLGLKMAVVLGLPSAAGLYLLADPLVRLLYPTYAPENLALTAKLLRVMSVSVVLLSLVQTTSGILQGFGHPLAPVKALAIGAIIKVAASWALISVPSLGIVGACIGTLLCYLVAAVMNTWSVARRTGGSLADIAGKPLAATAGMSAAVLGVQFMLRGHSGLAVVLSCTTAGVAAYLVLLLLLGGLTARELSYLPGGRRIAGAMERMRFLRD